MVSNIYLVASPKQDFGFVAANRETMFKSKPVTHRVLAQDRGRAVIFNDQGQIEWEIACPFVSHDIQMLPNGNILLHTGRAKLTEVTPQKQVVWEWESRNTESNKEYTEIHGFQRLKNGNTMLGETGNRRIIEVDRFGKIVKEVPYLVNKPNAHRDNRMVRKTDKGTYLACHEGDNAVREYDATGKVLWEYVLDLNNQPRTDGHDGHGAEVFGAMRLKNGNTMIAGGNNNRVFEVNKEGKTVWSVERDELPGIHLCWVTTLELLPNGNLIFGNTHAGPNNPQLIEVNRKKEVVWTFKNFDIMGNDLCAAQVVGVRGLAR
jgi:outer membrane protein assembly factor BamB